MYTIKEGFDNLLVILETNNLETAMIIFEAYEEVYKKMHPNSEPLTLFYEGKNYSLTQTLSLCYSKDSDTF